MGRTIATTSTVPSPGVIPRLRLWHHPRSTAVPSATAETAPTQRDRHLRMIAARGRMGWQKAAGYNRRALVEAAISRYKRVIGDALRFRTVSRQATEVAIAVNVLNPHAPSADG